MSLNLSLLNNYSFFLVAVSGGRDSVGLLYRLIDVQEKIPPFAVVSIDHRLREESKSEVLFVKKLTHLHHMPFYSADVATKPRGETQARQFRYDELVKIAQQTGAQAIATAHHRLDQLETRLMHLFRGTSPQGFLGIPEKRHLNDQVDVIRPALCCDPAWLHEGVDEWCEDESNQRPNNPRNMLRLEIIKQIQSLYSRDLSDAIESFIKLLKDDMEALDLLTPKQDILSREEFLRLPRALQSRWLRRFAPLDKAQVDRGIEAVLASKDIDLGQFIHLRVCQGTVSQKKLAKIEVSS